MDPNQRDRVALTLAPDGRYARVARTVVASCASLEGFSVDDLGDVRLLVDTAFHALAGLGAGAVDIALWTEARGLVIEMSSPRGQGRQWNDPDAAMLMTVASVVGFEREFTDDDDRLTMRIAVRPGSHDIAAG